jgi:hypothetical protein
MDNPAGPFQYSIIDGHPANCFGSATLNPRLVGSRTTNIRLYGLSLFCTFLHQKTALSCASPATHPITCGGLIMFGLSKKPSMGLQPFAWAKSTSFRGITSASGRLTGASTVNSRMHTPNLARFRRPTAIISLPHERDELYMTQYRSEAGPLSTTVQSMARKRQLLINGIIVNWEPRFPT